MTSVSTVTVSPTLNQFFKAIEDGDSETVRQVLSSDKSLLTQKRKSDYKYETDVELDAYKFLGAYLGSLTGLQVALLKARDIIDATLNAADLDICFGGGNTALHLATFLGAREIVKKLLGRGADRNIKAIDVLDDAEMREIYNTN